MVAVCNEKNQDVFKPLEKSAKGIVQVYTTTNSGKRFQKSQTKFNESKTINGKHWNIKVERN